MEADAEEKLTRRPLQPNATLALQASFRAPSMRFFSAAKVEMHEPQMPAVFHPFCEQREKDWAWSRCSPQGRLHGRLDAHLGKRAWQRVHTFCQMP